MSTGSLVSPPNPLATSSPTGTMNLDQPVDPSSDTVDTSHGHSIARLPDNHSRQDGKIATKIEDASGSDSGNDVRSPNSLLREDPQNHPQNQSQSPSNQSNGSSGFGDAVTSSAAPTQPPAQPFFAPYSTSSATHSFYPNQYPYVPIDMAVPYQNYSNIYANQAEF